MPAKTQKPKENMPLHYVADTKIKERPLAFVDLEFTGLGAENEIVQIGCVLVSQPASPKASRGGPGFQVVGEWQARVHPRHIENADPKALKLIGYTEEKWKDALPLKDALEQFNAFVKDAVLVGYNVVGDFYQLKKSFHQVGLMPAYHWQVLDVLSMIFIDCYTSGMDGFRMREVVRYFHLKQQEWHDALVDARATYEIFKKVMGRKHLTTS